MARGGPSRVPHRTQSKDHNAKQAQARKERKANQTVGGPSSIHDVFEYVTNQEEDKKNNSGSRSAIRQDRVSKRAQVNDLDDQRAKLKASKRRAVDGEDDDEEEDESEDDRDEDTFRQTAPFWKSKIGGEDEDEANVIRSEDDEEIDSDEAFGESDEEKFEGWKFGSSSRAATKKGGKRGVEEGEEQSDDEEEEDEEDEEEDDDDEGMMDLSKMLDGASESEEESDASSEDDDRLRQKMESIGAKAGEKRLADDDDDEGEEMAPNAKRRLLKERSEAVQEGQWNAPRNATGSSLLTIDDLMDPLKEQGGTAFTSLRNTAKTLKSNKGDSKQAVASKKGGGVLQAPLPSILQDRMDRSAAYDETKQEVQGWQATIKRIREAEHLSFPLQPDAPVRPSTSLMTSQFQPANSFERNIAAMLEKEGLSDKKIAEMEELKMNERGMSAEEIQERRNELRRMRDLIFREEQKAKRVSKIKSKTYRKIARKQRERDEEKAKAAGIVLDEDEDGDEEELEKAARQRAKERATLKHKNTGKWAKSTLGMHGAKDMPEARNAIEEQLRKGEQLRRRIQGQNSEDEDGGDEDDEGSDDNDEGESDNEKNAFDEMRAVQKKNDEERQKDEEAMQGKKGVWGMKFMKDARDRKARQTQEEVDNFEREMEQMDRSDRDSDEEDDEAEIAESRPAGSAPGRMVFNIAPASQSKEIAQVDDNSKGREAPEPKSIVVEDVRSGGSAGDQSANPWLSAKPSTKLSRKKNESIVSKEGSSIEKAANKIQKHFSRGDEERRQAEEDAQLDIDPESRLKLQGSRSNAKKAEKSRKQGPAEVGIASDEDNDESSDDEPVAIRGKGPAAIQQRDLVAEAFAGDDVMADFAAEKQALIEADAPQTIDTTLPGWGSWGGKGVRANKKKQEEMKKKFAKVVPGLDPTKRKDANMTNVIINQKKDKKADKYKGKDVPYPYTSRAQYEMAMRNPLGPEWNTRTQHQKLTLPRVVTKPGKAIKPIERLF